MKKYILCLGFWSGALLANAQEFTFGKPTSEEFALKRYDKDTSANAVVLREFGTATINSSDVDVEFVYHVRIKILNDKGFSKGNIEIPIRKSDANTFEQVRNIRGITFYPEQNGMIRSSDLDPAQVFKEKRAGKYHDLVKFALPNIREGSIIEYSYTLQSPFLFNFKNWEFQSDIPKIYSEFCALIPGVYNYNLILRGALKLAKNNAELVKECFSPGGGFKADCSKMTYAMENIPAFVEEDYMTAASNFKSALYYELSDYTDYNGGKHKVTKEWKDIDKELKTHENFGIQLKKKDFFKDKLEPVLQGKTSETEKATAIYRFIASSYKWNGYYGKYSDDGLKKSFEKHSGNVGDINLALVSAMNAAGISAEPVLLSTRSNGLVNTLFPVLSDFDYVVCKVNLGDTYHLLDATDPLLPFGLLPLRCINDKGRVMSFDKPSDWIELKASQRESSTISLNLSVDEAGKVVGNMDVISAGYEAYNKRAAIKKFNSLDEYVENLDERFPKVKFGNFKIRNMDSLENSLQESYSIEINPADDEGRLNISPFFMATISKNPFKLAERNYPVDLGAPSDTRIVMKLNLPKGMELVNGSSPIALALPNQGGRFLYQVATEENVISVSYNLSLSKSIYSNEEYHFLKELFNTVVKVHQSYITLKKKG